jgi:hypothetical protein
MTIIKPIKHTEYITPEMAWHKMPDGSWRAGPIEHNGRKVLSSNRHAPHAHKDAHPALIEGNWLWVED